MKHEPRLFRTATLAGMALVSALLHCPAAAQNLNINADLISAAHAGSESGVRAAIAQGAGSDFRNRLGDTALNLASKNGATAMARLLIESGAASANDDCVIDLIADAGTHGARRENRKSLGLELQVGRLPFLDCPFEQCRRAVNAVREFAVGQRQE
jgi:hypothetical protein